MSRALLELETISNVQHSTSNAQRPTLNGAVRTWYTAVVQDMVYTWFTFWCLGFIVFGRFLRADIRPQKTRARGVDLAEQQSTKPHSDAFVYIL
jgi:hypothetical protein